MSKHIAVWPSVRVFPVGKAPVVVPAGELIPAGVSGVELDNLVSFGAVVGIREVTLAEGEQPGPGQSDTKPAKVADILAEVGDDKAKAEAALELEQGAARPRQSLVEKLEAIVTAPPQS